MTRPAEFAISYSSRSPDLPSRNTFVCQGSRHAPAMTDASGAVLHHRSFENWMSKRVDRDHPIGRACLPLKDRVSNRHYLSAGHSDTMKIDAPLSVPTNPPKSLYERTTFYDRSRAGRTFLGEPRCSVGVGRQDQGRHDVHTRSRVAVCLCPGTVGQTARPP